MAVRGVHHTGIIVQNLDRSIYFYHDLLGLPIQSEPSPWFSGDELAQGVGVPGASLRQVNLRVGDGSLELLEYGNRPEGDDTVPPQNRLGSMHIALRVDDIAATVADSCAELLLGRVLSDYSFPDTLTTVLQDWRKGRRAEVAEVNGLAVDVLHAHGQPAPANERTVELACRIESGRARHPGSPHRTGGCRAHRPQHRGRARPRSGRRPLPGGGRLGVDGRQQARDRRLRVLTCSATSPRAASRSRRARRLRRSRR